jgi:quercetin dioxygenase-like cupin family protein
VDYRFIPDLRAEITPPADGILSRTLHNDDQLKVVLFGFAPGEELSEHTAASPAILHVLDGEVSLTLGEDAHRARAGAWVWMPPQLPHSVKAHTAAVLVLILIKTGRP